MPWFWSLLQQGCGRIVIRSAPDVFMLRAGLVLFRLEGQLAVEGALQDGAQAGIGAGLELQRALAGSFEPLVGVCLGQTQNPEAAR